MVWQATQLEDLGSAKAKWFSIDVAGELLMAASLALIMLIDFRTMTPHGRSDRCLLGGPGRLSHSAIIEPMNTKSARVRIRLGSRLRVTSCISRVV